MKIKKKTDKDQLIENAYRLFNTNGYHNTSIADIAETCRLTKGSLYHYITSKKELGELVIEYAHSYFKEHFFKIAYDSSSPVEERVLQLQNGFQEFFKVNKGGCLVANLSLEITNTVPEFLPKIRAFFSDWLDAFEFIFKSKYSIEDARGLAMDSLCHLQGAVMLFRVTDDASSLERWARMMKTCLGSSVGEESVSV